MFRRGRLAVAGSVPAFGGLLRQLRDDAGLTQDELAEAARVSQRAVSDLERGINRTARKDTALLLAGALGLDEQARDLFVAAARGRGTVEAVLAARQPGREPIDIVRFGNPGPGASPGVLLRFVDPAEDIPAAHMDAAAYARSVWAVLNGTGAQIRPARAVSGPVQGQAVLRIEYSAPSPPGNIGS